MKLTKLYEQKVNEQVKKLDPEKIAPKVKKDLQKNMMKLLELKPMILVDQNYDWWVEILGQDPQFLNDPDFMEEYANDLVHNLVIEFDKVAKDYIKKL